MTDTIFALSSGPAPAAIGVVRLSGPASGEAVRAMAGRLPPPRRAAYLPLRDPLGNLLDRAVVLWLPGPASATGEDTAEFHCHGGRAVIAAVENALAALPNLRRAAAGEFTRRAFVNGRIDLAEAEGLADLLSAETELQRRSALAMAGGGFSRQVDAWRERILAFSAAVEAVLDFADDDDVAQLPATFGAGLDALAAEIGSWLDRPHAEMLREGFRVVIAGPPNAGKSTLFNALLESEAAIVAPIAGTTRDLLVRSVAIDGVPFSLVDTAGLRESEDTVERIGVERALDATVTADLVLWLGDPGAAPDEAWPITAKADRRSLSEDAAGNAGRRISAVTGEGMDALRVDLAAFARGRMAGPREGAINRRQRQLLLEARDALGAGARGASSDPLILAEHLRGARAALDRLVGRSTTEDMLDALFGRFCIGK